MIGLAFGALSSLGTIGQFAGNLMGASARRAEMQDKVRALEMKKSSTIGMAAAQSGASGVEGSSSSTLDYLAGLGAEFDRAITTQKEVADSTWMADLFGAAGGLLGGGAQTAGKLGALNNWKFG
jgi:hypothetical protein